MHNTKTARENKEAKSGQILRIEQDQFNRWAAKNKSAKNSGH